MASPKDALTLERAETLARKIARYWRNRGHHVHVWAEQVPGFADENIYQVRSDMVCGLPRDYGKMVTAIAA